MSNVPPISPDQAVAEVLKLWAAGASPDALLHRLRELANDTAGQLGPAHVYQITGGYRDGYEVGRTVRLSGVAIDGEPLYRVAFDRGHWDGTKRKLLVAGVPLLAVAAIIALVRG
ncbi:hypothetical protein [Gemmata sp.]|uniref:hypothetical protein n=1 Tax=Gemmata sp. TaxID=1914242 RepID=UPI003F7235D6